MTFLLGFVLFALGLTISIAAHEFGHLVAAKAFGMHARRYFIGFGKTLWSFRRGETEYGLKVLPVGGFVDIAGMSHVEELPADDEPRAFWRYPAWKRVVVMAAGSVTHILLALLILYGIAVTAGLPTDRAIVGDVPACVVLDTDPTGAARGGCTSRDPVAPARQAGLAVGDRIVAVDGQRVNTFDELVAAIRSRPDQDVTLRYRRDSTERTATLHVAKALRPAIDGERRDAHGRAVVGVIGIAPAAVEVFGPISAVGATGSFTGVLMGRTISALGQFPSKIPKLVDALAGKPRDPDSPVSVVGASRVGGQAVEAGAWVIFFLLLAGLNIFIGIFNILPLLPLDGGHIAVLLFERARSGIARLFGRRDPGRVDPRKLAPIMVVFILLFGGISLLAIMADVVNPIANPFQ
ncbi:MAG TPA: M50 family metallopeptidase [Mycobacteriales bacterium]|nr:M50 family metallopeptidase [Mycobacteriales bacterium]